MAYGYNDDDEDDILTKKQVVLHYQRHKHVFKLSFEANKLNTIITIYIA